jgi:hypothetical protein
MSTRDNAEPHAQDRTLRAARLFARLVDAMERGELDESAEARAALAQLGVVVQVCADLCRTDRGRLRSKPSLPRDGADSREVAR